MKTLYVTQGTNILIDEENKGCGQMKESRGGIDSIFLVKEPMKVVWGYNGNSESVTVEENDIIITFYTKEFEKKLIVVKNEDWANNIKQYDAAMEEEKLRWASKCDNCETCNECGI